MSETLPILTLLVLLTALPATAQTPVATGSAWEAADVRTLESGEDQYVALSPDGLIEAAFLDRVERAPSAAGLPQTLQPLDLFDQAA